MGKVLGWEKRHPSRVAHPHLAIGNWGFHIESLKIHKLGFNQNYRTFTSILLIQIVLCSIFHCTKFKNHKYFQTRLRIGGQGLGCEVRSIQLRVVQTICFRVIQEIGREERHPPRVAHPDLPIGDWGLQVNTEVRV